METCFKVKDTVSIRTQEKWTFEFSTHLKVVEKAGVSSNT